MTLDEKLPREIFGFDFYDSFLSSAVQGLAKSSFKFPLAFR
jgi:hypothetical protein